MDEIVLITFGAGSPAWRRAAKRLAREARSSNWFSKVVVLNSRDLRKTDDGRKLLESGWFQRNPRGYGYWIYKPIFIKEFLGKHLGPNAILVWVDAGCSINVTDSSKARFAEYVDVAKNSEAGLGFIQTTCPERKWTKADLGRLLNVIDSEHWESGQIFAGFSIWKNSSEAKDIAQAWLELAITDDGHFIDDSPSIEPNHPEFVEHRHDQSIFSLLAKTRGFTLMPDDNFHRAKGWIKNGETYPIWTTRHRSGISFKAIKSSSFYRKLRRIEKAVEKQEKRVERLLN